MQRVYKVTMPSVVEFEVLAKSIDDAVKEACAYTNKYLDGAGVGHAGRQHGVVHVTGGGTICETPERVMAFRDAEEG
jgi:hypothetical protein